MKKAWYEFWKPGHAPSEVHVVKDATLDIQDGEFLVLVGPSGCGKSTTLRMIAGLEEASGGDIFIGDRRVNDVSPKDRDIAMVFQNYALYPHMNVYENMAFGLRLRKFAADEIDRRVKNAAELLSIGHLLQRKPKELSGGQRQRVAMGRAIVRRPKVYLMDEPLSNLDAKLRVQMRAELQKLHRTLGVTTIYVTHDQVEAMTLGDRIVLMKDGVIQQMDTPLALYERPANKYVAGFIGSPGMNFFNARLEKNDGRIQVVAGGFRLEVPAERQAGLESSVGQEVIFGMRPQDIHEAGFATDGPVGTVTATVEVLEPLGSEIYVYASAGPDPFVARVDAHSGVKLGESVQLVFDLRKMQLFSAANEQSLLTTPVAEPQPA
ncbi:MAG: sn-glycerol-3-phosphate ABC transporter ATP-binding protein UgpC [Candidatus Eremiobacterota bacterium]